MHGSMAVTYRLTEPEFVAAQRTLSGPAFGRRSIVLLPAGAMVLFGAAVLRSLEAAVIIVAAVVFLLLCWLLLLPRAWRRLYRKVPSDHREITLEFSPEGLELATPLSRGSVQWAAYSHYLENDALLLLLQPSRVAVPIPKRAFTPDELARFRALVEEHLPKGRPGRRPGGDRSPAKRS